MNKNQFTQIFYHDSCFDGITAASIALRHNPDAKCVGVRYQEVPPPTTEDDRVLIVDFSYPREVLLILAIHVKSVTVLDHHLTAEKELSGLEHPNLDFRFNQLKCGATLTWQYFQPDKPICHGLELIEDRDLWLKMWPEQTAAFTAGLGLLTPEQRVPGDHWYKAVMEDWATTIERGQIVVQYQRNLIASLLKNARFEGAIQHNNTGFYNRLSLNCPFLQSDLGEALLATDPNTDYADIYWTDGDGRINHSLRSRPGSNVDVSAIAKAKGGGGHKHAAGYKEG